jgi:hypothetical protein
MFETVGFRTGDVGNAGSRELLSEKVKTYDGNHNLALGLESTESRNFNLLKACSLDQKTFMQTQRLRIETGRYHHSMRAPLRRQIVRRHVRNLHAIRCMSSGGREREKSWAEIAGDH